MESLDRLLRIVSGHAFLDAPISTTCCQAGRSGLRSGIPRRGERFCSAYSIYPE